MGFLALQDIPLKCEIGLRASNRWKDFGLGLRRKARHKKNDWQMKFPYRIPRSVQIFSPLPSPYIAYLSPRIFQRHTYFLAIPTMPHLLSVEFSKQTPFSPIKFMLGKPIFPCTSTGFCGKIIRWIWKNANRRGLFNMAGRSSSQNIWILLLLLLAGIILGGFLGNTLENISFLRWLNYGSSFGLSSPLVLELGVLRLQFGLTIRFTVAGMIGMILAFFIYRKI